MLSNIPINIEEIRIDNNHVWKTEIILYHSDGAIFFYPYHEEYTRKIPKDIYRVRCYA